jgi:hypothetical protein
MATTYECDALSQSFPDSRGQGYALRLRSKFPDMARIEK